MKANIRMEIFIKNINQTKIKNKINHKIPICILLGMCSISLLSSFNQPNKHSANLGKEKIQPKIVNIVNFIRLLEPRDSSITEEVLYQTVVKQVQLMKQYKLGGTFLLQYDALMDIRYQQLLKNLPRNTFEIGAWWEIPQPLVEKAGLKWRGRYPWDWHADVGFSTGYTPEEREKLADVYMNDFKKIFGYYPKSVACWFIDAHTLNYLYQKYKIVASANCKDQFGTDGYTLWGATGTRLIIPAKLIRTCLRKMNRTRFRFLFSECWEVTLFANTIKDLAPTGKA